MTACEVARIYQRIINNQNIMQGLEDSQASTFEWIKTKILLKLIEDSRTITVALEQTSNFNSNFINIVHTSA